MQNILFKMSIVHALTRAFWYGLVSMTCKLLLPLGLPLPQLNHWVLCWWQVNCFWDYLESLCFTHYALLTLSLWYWLKQLICWLWSVSCHIRWFLRLFLIRLTVNLPPILRLLVHFAIRCFCLCTNLIE